ncbi:MAG: sensor histidine kinase, partial [Nitrososphaeraceae archaeon]
SVRILVPGDDEQIKEIINEVHLAMPRLEIRSLDKSLQTRMGILVVDRKQSVIIELKDDTKNTYYDAAGLSTYSNSEPIAVSYASIFDILWRLEDLYEQLKAYSAMQREFINIAAHELRTPIQPILGLSQVLLIDQINDDDHSKELISIINRNAERLQRLVEDLLDVTKIESKTLHLRKEKFNLDALMNRVVSEFEGQNERKQINKRIIVTGDKDIDIEGDKGRISQVLSNLISNAIKFSEEGSVISISQRNQESDNVVIVSVANTGTGIDSSVFPRLFTKFTSSFEKGGTGLGLYISKSIVEAHGGKIWTENNPNGNGATFTFSLPLTP